MDEIQDALRVLQQAKAAKAKAEVLIEATQSLLVKCAEREQVKTLIADVDGQRISATVVASERLAYDEKALKKALGDKWKTIRVEKVDAAKLKTAITEGKVDASAVAEHITISKSKPYLRLSVVASIQQQDS